MMGRSIDPSPIWTNNPHQQDNHSCGGRYQHPTPLIAFAGEESLGLRRRTKVGI